MSDSEIDHSLDGESQVDAICAILSVGCILTTGVVCLRIYTRTILLRTFGVEDAFMIAAQLLAIGSAVAIGLGTPCEPPRVDLTLANGLLSRDKIRAREAYMAAARRVPYPLHEGIIDPLEFRHAHLLTKLSCAGIL